MATTVYSLGAGSTFNQSEALAGRLCIIVASSYDPGEHPTIDASDTTNFKGSGFVKVVNNTLTLVVDNIPWYFDINGIGIGANSNGYKLYLGVVDTTGITVHGNYIEGIHANPQTRSGANSIIIDNLNPLDQFAIQALQSILNKVQNPTDLSDSDVNRYCQAAYQWASNMMINAANLRNDITDNYTQSQGTATVSSLDSNIEKLLNNLIIELASTNKAHTDEEGVWSKVGQTSVNGYYNDTTAQTLPKTGGGTCSSIADAEADGWSWKASHYSERQENTIVGFQNLINATNLSTLNKAVDTTQGSEKLKIGGNVAVSGGVAVSNASGSNLNVKTANNENVSIKGGDTYNNNGTSISDVIKVAVVAGGGGGSTGGTVDVNSMPNLTISTMPLLGGTFSIGSSGLGNSASNPLYISGSTTINKASIPTIQAGDTYTIQEVAVFKYDALGTSLYKVGMDALGVPVLSGVSSFPATPDRGHYYKLNTNAPIGTVDITLPAVINQNASVVGIIIYHFECSANASFSVTSTSPIKFRGSNPGSTLAAGTYEVDCLDNGSYWIVGVTVIVS